MVDFAWDQRIAGTVARPLVALGVHPNAVTTVGLLAGLASGYLYSLGEPGLSDWAALLFVYVAFNDHLDGEVARRANKTSRFGHFYDHVAVGVSYVAMFVGAGFGMRGGPLGDGAVVLGALAGAAVTLIFSVRVWVEQKVGAHETRQGRFAGFEAEDTLYLVGPITWLEVMPEFIALAGVGAPLYLLWVCFRARRAARLRRAGGDA